MKIIKKMRWFPALTTLLLVLYPPQAFALLPQNHRDDIPDPLIKIVLTIHIFGIIFWIGGLGMRLFLLGAIILDMVASRRFETVRETGKEGQAMGLGLILAGMAVLMLFASNQ